ncbi:PQQ-binding-like beta-propeller repeat protein [Spirillospora sp. NPDC052269]
MPETKRSSPATAEGTTEGKKKRPLLLQRPRLTVAAFVAAALAAGAVFYVTVMSGDGVRGPFGAFPSPVATAPPLGPARQLATLQGDVKVTGGLALQDDDTSRLRAINIRTGKVYWELRRHGDNIAQWDLDGAGAAFIAWRSGRVERVDIRSGKLRWHRRFAGSMRGLRDGVRLSIDGTGPVSVGTAKWRHGQYEGWQIFLDRGTGRERWRIKTFSDTACAVSEDSVQRAFSFADTLVVTEDCRGEEAPGHLAAYDATGHRRWQLDLRTSLSSGDHHTYTVKETQISDRLLAVSNSDFGDGYTLVDAIAGRTARKLPYPARFPDDHRWASPISVNACSAPHPKAHDLTDPYLCAQDLRTNKELWTVQMPEGFRNSDNRFTVSDGRLYTVLAHTDAANEIDVEDAQQVGVFELRTGRLLGRIPLSHGGVTPVPQEVAYAVSDVADGVVSVTYHSREERYVKLFAA